MTTRNYAELDQPTRDALHEQAGHDCSQHNACMHFSGDYPTDLVNYADRAELAQAEREHGYAAPAARTDA